MLKYYVYAFIREDGSPYYIGKGTGDRRLKKRYCGVQPPSDRRYIVIMEENLTELGAFALERRYIRWYGRKDNGTGILRNMTDGGEGTCGMFGKKHSKETKEKLSAAHKGITFKKSHKNKISAARKRWFQSNQGKKWKEVLRKKKVGIALSPEIKRKISTSLSKTNKGKKWYTNGINMIFVKPGNQPDDYIPGYITRNSDS